jgi:3-hydroxyisobutyrate dehydrogenase
VNPPLKQYCLSYAEQAGLDPHKVLASIGTGAAGGFLLNNLGPKMIDRNFAPGFFVEHFLKGLTIVADDGTQALFKVYEQVNEVE